MLINHSLTFYQYLLTELIISRFQVVIFKLNYSFMPGSWHPILVSLFFVVLCLCELCVCVYACLVDACECVGVHKGIHEQIRERNQFFFPLLHLALLPMTKFITELDSPLFVAKLADKSYLDLPWLCPLYLTYIESGMSFHVDAAVSNSGPYVYTATSLKHWIFSLVLVFLFWID